MFSRCFVSPLIIGSKYHPYKTGRDQKEKISPKSQIKKPSYENGNNENKPSKDINGILVGWCHLLSPVMTVAVPLIRDG